MTSSSRSTPAAVLPIARGPIARCAAIGHTFSCRPRRFGCDVTIITTSGGSEDEPERMTRRRGCDGCTRYPLPCARILGASDPATSPIGCIRGVTRATDLSAFTSRFPPSTRVRDSSSTFRASRDPQVRGRDTSNARMLRNRMYYSALKLYTHLTHRFHTIPFLGSTRVLLKSVPGDVSDLEIRNKSQSRLCVCVCGADIPNMEMHGMKRMLLPRI